jgi:hypothetical protein
LAFGTTSTVLGLTDVVITADALVNPDGKFDSRLIFPIQTLRSPGGPGIVIVGVAANSALISSNLLVSIDVALTLDFPAMLNTFLWLSAALAGENLLAKLTVPLFKYIALGASAFGAGAGAAFGAGAGAAFGAGAGAAFGAGSDTAAHPDKKIAIKDMDRLLCSGGINGWGILQIADLRRWYNEQRFSMPLSM